MTSQSDILQLQKESPMVWSSINIQLPKSSDWDFTHRRWQEQIFDDTSRELAIIKPTQIGMTTVMLCKMLHYAAFNSIRAMYTLPRQDDVTDLINGRFHEMAKSPTIAKLLGDIDNVRLKSFGKSYLHFMESSVTPRMLDVDLLVNDEVDMSNQDNLEQYIARLDASNHKVIYRISTPTIPDFGIDKYFKLSDMKRWMVKCPRCNTYQELDWDTHHRHKNGETWYACMKCNKMLLPYEIQSGEWVAERPGVEMSGYAVNQMMTTYIEPSKLYGEYKRMKPKNFYNLRLGKPYTQTTNSFSKEEILERCFGDIKHANFGDGYFLGCDQGNDLHVAIGARMPNGEIAIVHLEVVPFEVGFDRIRALMNTYGIRRSVIDALPNKHTAHELANEYAEDRVYLAYFTTVDKVYKNYPADRKVNISKPESYDALLALIKSNNLFFYGNRGSIDENVNNAIDHLCNMRRDTETQVTRIGGEITVARWVNTGADHFADAINYMTIAADMSSASSSLSVMDINEEDENDEEFDPGNQNPYYRASKGYGSNLWAL